MAKSKKKPLMSDIGLQMQETIDKVKTMKGHTVAKEKLADMEKAVSLIKKAYFNGIKTAEDLAAGNEDFDATDKEKSKADKVINKLRVGWSDANSDFRRDRAADKLQQSVEDAEALSQINSNSPDLQDFSTESMTDNELIRY